MGEWKLTPLDRAVLAALDGAAQHTTFVEREVNCRRWGEVSRAEILGVLRGAEHLGLTDRQAGGRWTLTTAGHEALASGAL